MNDNPAAWMAIWLASEIMPASATTLTSVSWWVALKALMTGSMVAVSAPSGTDLPDWLNLTVPDDRLVASALLLQSRYSGSALHVATSDINLQTKLLAVGLPFTEPPDT